MDKYLRKISNKVMKKYKPIYVQMAMRFVSGILLLSMPNLHKPEPKRKEIKS